MIPISGVTQKRSTLWEGRLGLTHMRPSYRHIGTHPFPKSVSVWRSQESRPRTLSHWTRPLIRCTHWLLTGNFEPRHWVVTPGKRSLVPKAPCSTTVTEKGLMQNATTRTWAEPEQESASLETTKTTALLVIPESDLEQGGVMMTPTLVGWKQSLQQTMEIGASKPWDISSFSDLAC